MTLSSLLSSSCKALHRVQQFWYPIPALIVVCCGLLRVVVCWCDCEYLFLLIGNHCGDPWVWPEDHACASIVAVPPRHCVHHPLPHPGSLSLTLKFCLFYLFIYLFISCCTIPFISCYSYLLFTFFRRDSVFYLFISR